MKTRIVLAAAAATTLIACGKESCPTTAGAADTSQDMTTACSLPAAQTVAISVHLCETCSHTSPTCAPQISGTDIFLDTRWEVCTDNSSCSFQSCSFASCSMTLADGSYTVHALDVSGGTRTFSLTLNQGALTCGPYI